MSKRTKKKFFLKNKGEGKGKGKTHNPNTTALVGPEREVDALAQIRVLRQAPRLAPPPHDADGDQGRGAAAAPAGVVAAQPGVVDGPRGGGHGPRRHAVVLAGRRADDDGAGGERARHDHGVEAGDRVRLALVVVVVVVVAGEGEVERLRAVRQGNPCHRCVVLDRYGLAG